VRVAAAGYAGLLGLLTWQALRGEPLLEPDAATLTAAGILVVLTAAAAAAALQTRTSGLSQSRIAVSSSSVNGI
jgi:hypothetical protein